MTLTYLALFAGYGGLEMGVQSVLGGELVAYSEFEPPTPKNPRPKQGAARIMAHHHPGVPNLGDVTRINWRAIGPGVIDVVTGGSPCQDISTAGRQAGMRAGTRSGLWGSMCDAIQILRPRLVVWENVRGALSSEADSDLEPCAGCVGDGTGKPAMRALGRVLGDLAELGYDAWWTGLRAADIGAPHNRYRIFVFAWPADSNRDALRLESVDVIRRGSASEPRWGSAQPSADTRGEPRGQWGVTASREASGGRAFGEPERRHGTSSHDADGIGSERVGRSRQGRPRPTNDGGPTPDADGIGSERVGRLNAVERDPHRRRGQVEPRGEAEPATWGVYADGVARWERVLERPAPSPTEPSAKGGQRLSPRFVEWLMGLADGHVTGVPDIARADQLKALGNGVVPQQAAEATRRWLTWREAVAA